jgi:hypothetical protein
MATEQGQDNYTKLIDAMRALYADDRIFDLVLRESGIVRTAERLATILWVRQIPEDENTTELRRQLTYLWEEGRWDF